MKRSFSLGAIAVLTLAVTAGACAKKAPVAGVQAIQAMFSTIAA